MMVFVFALPVLLVSVSLVPLPPFPLLISPQTEELP